MNKRNAIAITSVIFVLIVLLIRINPFNLKGTAIRPANSDFDDINFYSCVLNSYFSDKLTSDILSSELYDNYNQKFNTDYNTYISTEKLSSIKNLSCDSSYRINSLKGIEKLTNIENLKITKSGVKSLDLSKNSKLKTIEITDSVLENINLPQTDSLTSLLLNGNNLKEIDLSKLNNLSLVNLNDNNIESYKLNSNISDTKISFVFNNLSKLDFSNINTKDSIFYQNYYLDNTQILSIPYNFLQKNKITEVIFSENESIKLKNELYFSFNMIKGPALVVNNDITIEELLENLTLTNLNIKVFDILSNVEIQSGKISDMSRMDIYNSDGQRLFNLIISEFNNNDFDYTTYGEIARNANYSYTPKYVLNEEDYDKLTYLNLRYVSKFNLSKLKKLKYLNIQNSSIDSLDFSNIDFIENVYLNCFSNLVTLNGLNNKTNLSSVGFSHNKKITFLDLSNSDKLQKVSVNNNNSLSNIKITTSINELNLSNNNLSELNIENMENLRLLYLMNNDLSELDFEKILGNNKRLIDLDVTGNNLSEIKNIDKYKFEYIEASNNSLTSINLGNQEELLELNLSFNEIENLNVSDCKNLFGLIAYNNKLTKIVGIEKLSNLEYIILSKNNIKQLDLSKNTNLLFANLEDNPIKKDEIILLKGDSIKFKPNLKLPDTENVEVYNSDEDVIRINGNNIEALDDGESVLTYYFLNYDGIYDVVGIIDYKPYKVYVSVYDIKSKKYAINKSNKYIYVGTEENVKAIRRYVNVSGDGFSKKIENNKIKILYEDKEINSFDIIKVSSEKYDLNGDTIKYKNNFNIDDIKITNAKLNIVEDYLQIIYNDTIVKTFELVKEK